MQRQPLESTQRRASTLPLQSRSCASVRPARSPALNASLLTRPARAVRDWTTTARSQLTPSCPFVPTHSVEKHGELAIETVDVLEAYGNALLRNAIATSAVLPGGPNKKLPEGDAADGAYLRVRIRRTEGEAALGYHSKLTDSFTYSHCHRHCLWPADRQLEQARRVDICLRCNQGES